MNSDENVLVVCELEQKDAINFLTQCEFEGFPSRKRFDSSWIFFDGR